MDIATTAKGMMSIAIQRWRMGTCKENNGTTA
jgi:hypothetical protein